MSEWIEVEKELPPEDTDLWVYNGRYVIEFYLVPCNLKEIKSYLSNCGVTHWMVRRKPDPPQKKGESEK